MILLDTCSLLWLAAGSTEFSPRVKSLLDSPHQLVFVSAISTYEIGQKVAAGRLFLPVAANEWFQGIIRQHDLIELPVTSAICFRAASLPLLHRDPFDRLLIATSHEHGLTLLTPDDKIQQYPETKTLW